MMGSGYALKCETSDPSEPSRPSDNSEPSKTREPSEPRDSKDDSCSCEYSDTVPVIHRDCCASKSKKLAVLLTCSGAWKRKELLSEPTENVIQCCY